MKKHTGLFIFSATLIISGSLLFSTCKNHTARISKPEYTAVKFLKHLAKYEFEEARKLGTENTAKMLDMLQMMLDMARSNGKADELQPQEIEIKVINTAIKGKRAVVNYFDQNGKQQQMELIKEHGKWLVDMKKEMPKVSSGSQGFFE